MVERIIATLVTAKLEATLDAYLSMLAELTVMRIIGVRGTSKLVCDTRELGLLDAR